MTTFHSADILLFIRSATGSDWGPDIGGFPKTASGHIDFDLKDFVCALLLTA